MFCSVYLNALYNGDKRSIRDFSFKKLAPNLICKFSYEYTCVKKMADSMACDCDLIQKRKN